jgi:hypothetical protein
MKQIINVAFKAVIDNCAAFILSDVNAVSNRRKEHAVA